MKYNNIAIIVSSCDKNCDVWDLFFILFQKYFPNNVFNTYLFNNFKEYNFDNIKIVKSLKISSWSSELKACLLQIPENIVILFLDDYFLYKPTDSDLLFKLLEFFIKNELQYMQISAFPKKFSKAWFKYEIVDDNLRIGKIFENQPYRISLQVSIWQKNFLIELLHKEMNPWQFEESVNKNLPTSFKTYYYYGNPNLKYVHGPFTYICSGITQGVWMRESIKLAKKEGIKYDFSKRKTENYLAYIYRMFYTSSPFFVRHLLDYCRKNLKF
ncbi:MAG: hypothetical protein N3A01_06985 [Bacteroidales bacterium]|nr:hypothetical protein [Bacteroidales bacterium]